MDIPGIPDLLSKLQTQCGPIPILMAIAIVWLAWRYVKMTTTYQEREEKLLKTIDEDKKASSLAYDKLAVSHAKLEGMLLAAQAARRDG